MYIGNTKAAAPAKAGSRELYKLRLVKLHGHWLEKKTILWKKNEHSRWLYSSIQGAIFPRLIITSSGVDTQVTSESVLIRFESVPMFVSTFSFLLIRRPVPSTDQALPSCFSFRISRILMERPWNFFFGSCGFLKGLRS